MADGAYSRARVLMLSDLKEAVGAKTSLQNTAVIVMAAWLHCHVGN